MRYSNVGFWDPQFIFTSIPLSLCYADHRTAFICIFSQKISRIHFYLSTLCLKLSRFLSITSTHNVTVTRTLGKVVPPFCNVMLSHSAVPTFQHWWHDMSMIRNFWAGKNNKGELKTLKPHNGAKFLFKRTPDNHAGRGRGGWGWILSEFNSYLSFNRFRFALSWYMSESFLSFVILLWPF